MLAGTVFATLALLGLSASDPSGLRYYSLGISAGLANSSVYCIRQDSRGLMWFGTFGGLSRWDGETFTTWRPRPDQASLSASVIFSLMEGDGCLWVATDGGGLSRFDMVTEGWSTWRADPADPGRLSSDRVFALGRDAEGRIWAGSADGVVNILDPKSGKVLRLWPPDVSGGDRVPASPVRCIARTLDGTMWVGTEGSGLIEVTPGFRAIGHTHEAGNPASLGSDTVRSLLVDSKGRLWIGLGNGSVDLRSGAGFEHASLPPGGAPRQAVRALGEDDSGTIWVGWAEAGIGTIDPGTGALSLPGPQGAANVRALYRDRSGLMWAGLKDGGARAYNPRSAAFSRHETMVDGTRLRGLRGLAETHDGKILAGTDGLGLVELDRRDGSVRTVPGTGKTGDERKVYAVSVAKDSTIWYGTDGAGLFALSPGGKLRQWRHGEEPGSLGSNVVWCILEEADGGLWIGTEGGGLDWLAPGSDSFVHHRPDPFSPSSLRGASVRSVFRDSKKRLWVATWDGGISRLLEDGKTFVSYGPEAGKAGSLADSSVNAIFEDSARRIWIGTGGAGLERFDEARGLFERIGEEEGLAAATVNGIVESAGGELWISTQIGLSRWIPDSGTWLSYGLEDGLAGAELSQNSYLRARDGSLWFGGPEGLSSFDPAAIDTRAAPPSVAITAVVAHGSGLVRRRANGDLVLDWRNAGLSFTIGVLDYVAPDRNRYAMRIEGRQANWTQLGHVNTGYIAPLAPGTWVLAATGSDGNGIWSQSAARLSIQVVAPFWLTPAFGALVALVLGAGVASLILFRIRTLHARNALLVKFSRHIELAREEERTDAAREVHDGIGQHLVVLNLQAFWLASHPDASSEERAPRVDEMRDSISRAMAEVKNVATKFRPVALDSLSVAETVRWYARDFGRRTGIQAAVEVAGDFPQCGDEAATALFRVLQEALSNVARHAGPCQVRVELRVEGGDAVLEISDDGVGLPEGVDRAEDSFGLIGMRERCASLGGGIRISGSPGAGTRLLATLPLARVARPGATEYRRNP